jgi:hypothetical protein
MSLRQRLQFRWKARRKWQAVVKPHGHCPMSAMYLFDPAYVVTLPRINVLENSAEGAPPLTYDRMMQVYGEIKLLDSPTQGKLTYLSDS